MKKLTTKRSLYTYGAGVVTGVGLVKFFFVPVVIGLGVVAGGVVLWKVLTGKKGKKGRH
jgi:hypothetical protein